MKLFIQLFMTVFQLLAVIINHVAALSNGAGLAPLASAEGRLGTTHGRNTHCVSASLSLSLSHSLSHSLPIYLFAWILSTRILFVASYSYDMD